MRYFFSTGEASGESSALLLAQAIRDADPQAQFEGIGSEADARAGFHTVARSYRMGEHGTAGGDSAHSQAACNHVAHGVSPRSRRNRISSCSSISACSICAWR